MALDPNTTVSHYKILSPIGKGGMGEVYLAQDTKLNRKVAIKFLSDEFSRDSDKLNRFIQEAQAASALNHPNIVTVFEIGEADDSRFIALEHIEGETLTKFLKKKLKFESALDIAIQLASALDAAHSAGIVHRDIKPDNVMIRKDGIVKILDFGIAKLSGPGTDAAGSVDNEGETAVQVNTSPGMIIGTANYMSPEQAKGKGIDSRTDIFSFGVVLYEMIAGHLPFPGDSPLEIIGSILNKEPRPIENPDVPPELERIVSKSLRKDPDERYQTMKGLAADLKDFKRQMDFQNQLDKTVQPERGESETQVFQATTAADGQQTTAGTTNDSISIKRSSLGKILGAVAVLLVLISLGIGYWYFTQGESGQINSIAVMPFQNDSATADSEYLSDGLVETLIYRLSQIEELKVSPSSSVFRYKGKQSDSVSAGKELGVEAVMTGKIAQRGDDLIISVELVDVRNSKTLWGERYNRKMADLLATQREITNTIIQKLQLKLAGEDEEDLRKEYTSNSEAYELYLKGRFHYEKRTKADIEKGIDYYDQALALDKSFALAYVGIANAYGVMPSYGYIAPKEAGPKGMAAARKALEIDPNLADAHAAVAYVAAALFWDWETAEREFGIALEMDPNNAATRVRYGYNYLLPMARTKEAVDEIKRALELEPLSIPIGSMLADAYLEDGQFDKALEQITRTDNLEPGHPTSAYWLMSTYAAKGMCGEALRLADKRLEKTPDDQDTLSISGYCSAKTGNRGKAEAVIAKFRELSKTRFILNSYIAQIYYALDEKDKAFAALEKAVEERDFFIPTMRTNPMFAGLRREPRFGELMKRTGLPDLD
ncbi:MAG: protein kinase [Acidobacteriota bacterium]|nr:MAG: protein kinase [Acidobacteriota bacterium]